MKLDEVVSSQYSVVRHASYLNTDYGILNTEPRAKRKGQFFVMTAVAVILVLYGLSDFLKIQSFDATGIQGNALPRIARSVEDNINKTVVYSPPASAANNLDELIALEKESLKSAGYSLDVKYNLTSAPKTATIIILYPGEYYEKLVPLG